MLTEHEQATKLRRTFDGILSKLAFKEVDGELRVCGKFAEVSVLDTGGLDVWIVKPDRNPMGTGKLNNICRDVLASIPEAQIQRLDGEAWFQTEVLPESLFKPLGIRQKRRYSEEQLKAAQERMNIVRNMK